MARAVLRVTPAMADGGGIAPASIPLQFFRILTNTWSESSVTFSNPPPGVKPPTVRVTGAALKDRVTAPCVAANTVLEVDVTEMVREAARVNADSKLSIGIIRMDDQGGFNCSLYSKEDTGAASRKPQLVYAMGRPVPPTAVLSNGYMQVSWPAYRGATGYVLRRAEGADGAYAVLTNTASTAFKDVTVFPGKSYAYTLAAVTAGGEGDPSLPAAVQVQMMDYRYPAEDTYIEANGGTTATTSHGGDTVLMLKRDPVREDFFKFDVTGLENAAHVRFRACLSAQDGTAYVPINFIVRYGDFGDWNEYGVTYATPPKGYAPPSDSTLAKGTNELARIRCTYADPANLYDNFIEADVTEKVREAAQAGKRYLTLFLTGDSTSHSPALGGIRVLSREHSDVLRRPALLFDGSGFAAPQGLRAEAQADAPGFTLTWRAVTGADHYIITRSGPTDKDTVVVASSVTGTSYTDANAAFWTDRAYTYTVTAVNLDGTESGTAHVTASLTRTFTRPILADTFVRGGAYTNDNFALSPWVELKGDVIDYEREGFFRVAVTNLPEIVKAQLRLKLYSTNVYTDSTIVLLATNDTGWAESGAPSSTWSNVVGPSVVRTPDPGDDPALITRFNLKAAGYVPGDDMFFDITPQLKAAQARSESTLMVQMFITTQNGQGNISICSRQSLNPYDAPYVLYTVSKKPASGTMLLLK